MFGPASLNSHPDSAGHSQPSFAAMPCQAADSFWVTSVTSRAPRCPFGHSSMKSTADWRPSASYLVAVAPKAYPTRCAPMSSARPASLLTRPYCPEALGRNRPAGDPYVPVAAFADVFRRPRMRLTRQWTRVVHDDRGALAWSACGEVDPLPLDVAAHGRVVRIWRGAVPVCHPASSLGEGHVEED